MKLDLHKLLNQFWQLRRSKRITSLQADLYMFLVQECNTKFWENPFECSNVLIKASIGISEPSLIDARNRLKQLGLIEFQSGIRNQNSPVYQLLYLNNLSRNRGESIVTSLVETEENDVHIKKQKPDKNKTSKSHSGASPPGPEKKESSPHWEKAIETWFLFYEKQYGAKPTFNATTAKSLKHILNGLEKIAKVAGEEWTEDTGMKYFKKFLFKAHRDEWLKANFLLPVLSQKFDSIVNSKNDGTATNRGTHNQTNRADLVSAGQDTSAAILREQLGQLEP